MTLCHEYTQQDLREISTLLPYRIFRTYRNFLVMYVCIYTIILSQRPHWWTLPIKDAPFLIIAAAAVLVLPGMIRARIRSVFRQRLAEALRGRIDITITEEGSTFKTARSESTMEWSLFDRQNETENFIALHARSGGIRPFPKRAFSPQQFSDFRALLSLRIGRKPMS